MNRLKFPKMWHLGIKTWVQPLKTLAVVMNMLCWSGLSMGCDEMESGTDEVIIQQVLPLPTCDEAITDWKGGKAVPGDDCTFTTICDFSGPASLRCVDGKLVVDCTVTTTDSDTEIVTLVDPEDTCLD